MKKSYQLLCLLLTLLAFSTKSIAQNNLAAGDLAIVSYQSDTDPTNTFNPLLLEFDDRFSIVVLKPGGLAAGTVIYITDRGWDGPNNIWLDEAYPPFTFGIGSEAVIKWVVPAGGIIQGKEVFFIGKYHDELAPGSEYYQWFAYSNENGTVPLGAITNETPIVPTALPPPNGFTDGMSLFNAGDNILVFQTGPPAGPASNYNDATRRFITAILANIRPTDVGVPTSYAAWDVAPNVQNESSIPPGLVNGQTCFLMSPGPLPHPTSPVPGTVEPDNGKFSNCALSLAGTCTALQMSALIYTPANWTYSNTVFPVTTSSSFCTYNILPNNTVTLSSAAGTNAQTVCINTPIINITYNTTGATGATVTGLPAGVSGSWAANVVTISGTPTVAGAALTYTVTLTGGCGTVTTTGTIAVTANNTVTLTSAAGTNAQTRCINTAITNITYSTTGATGATVTGLPVGVSGSWAANVVTISGTPTVAGAALTYTVTLTGGCGTVTATGTITVSANNTVTLSSAAGTDAQTVPITTPITNITYATTGATGATVTGLPPGVTGSWAANVVTISGSPTSAAGSPYTYTVTLTGGCGTVTTTGTITVTTCAVTLTSAPGTNAQSVCNNTAITNITYATVGATGATFSGLPPGVTGIWLADVVTISGTPTATAVYNYTVTQVGGACNSTVANGTITVTGFNTVTLSSAAGTDAQTVCINTPITNITYATTVATGATVTGLPAGVTGAWAANVVTISGTPTASGTFNYTVNLTGGGGCGTITANGTITVTPANTITLSSAAGTDAQTVCVNTAITNITYATTGATGATFSGLPAGVTGAWAANVVTISGTPTASGTFNYTVTLTGGCGTITATGTITVSPNNTITLTSAAGTNAQVRCVNTPITNITYSTTGATGATFAGLPPGVNGNWAGNVVTIFGTPTTTVGSPFNYTVTLTGGCGTVTATGTITVNPAPAPFTIGGAGTFCQDAVVTLTGPVDPNYTYQWGRSLFGAPFTNMGTVQTQPVTASGFYRLTVTNQFNCSTTGPDAVVNIADYVFNGSLGAGDAVQTGRINRFAVLSTCAAPKVCPGIFTATGSRFYDAYTITNVRNTPVCVTIGHNSGCTTNAFSVAYLGSFNPAAPCTNYLADPGSSPTTSIFYEAIIPANGTIVVVLHEVNPGAGCASYQLTVDIPRDPSAITVTPGTPSCTPITLTAPVANTYLWAPGGAVTQSIVHNTGTTNYTVTLGYGNNACTATASQSVTITPNNTITLTSGAGTNLQSVVVNTPITNITYATTGATGATITGLPAGVSGIWAANVVTISGSPTVLGSFNYTVTLTGGCGTITATGTIIVTCANNNWAGTTSNNWFIPANWSCGIVPLPAMNVLIPSGTPFPCVIPSGTAQARDLTINAGASLTNNGTLNINGGGVVTTAGTYMGTGTFTGAVYNNTGGVVSPGLSPGCTLFGSGYTNGSGTEIIEIGGTTVCTQYDQLQVVGTATLSGTLDVQLFGGFVPSCGQSFKIMTSNTLVGTFATILYPALPAGLSWGIQYNLPNPGDVTLNILGTPTATATPASQTTCSAAPITTIVLSGSPIAGTVYNWTRDNSGTVTGIAASGSGDISGTLTNLTNIPITVTFTITPVSGTCTGASITATVQVNPTPDVNQPANQVVCNGAPTAAVTFTGSVTAPPGTVFNWTNNTPSIGLAASGTGNIASFTATNAGTTPVVATVVVTPTYTSGGGGPLTQTFNFTGALQTWTVPAGVTSVDITAFGAQGNTNALGVVGGLGGQATGTLAVTPGQVLNINVGGGGITSTSGGFNGGANAGVGASCVTAQGGGGGGASDVRIAPNGLADRVIVAAGGGGAGGNRVATCGRGTGGGGGGGYYGGGGGAGWPSASVTVPLGGTQVAGGAGGTSTFAAINNGFAGVLGLGGNGGEEVGSNQAGSGTASSGGIGGGLTGGNGTYPGNFVGQSGAGGSSYTGGVTAGATTPGLQTGNGQVTITYIGSTTCTGTPRTFTYTVNPTPVASITPAGPVTICQGSSVTLTASATCNSFAFSGLMSGAQEVPANASTARAVFNGTFNSSTNQLTLNVVFDGLTGGAATAAHVHNAAVGINGPVIIPLAGFPAATSGSYSNTFTVPAAQVANLLAGNTYINIHNAGFPGGEIRGQITNLASNVFTLSGSISGAQEVPANASTATGNFAGTYNNNTSQLTLNLIFNNLTGGNATAAHVHSAAVGVNGPVIIPLSGFPAAASGSYTNVFTMPAAQVANFLAGNTYINIHNAVFPGGEVRGQIAAPAAVCTGVTYLWTPGGATTQAITVTTANTYSVIATVNGCNSAPASVVVNVNPIPTVNAVANQIVCNGAPTTAVNFTGTPVGVVFNWTNSDPTIGLAASGTGNIASFTAINTGTAPVVATITVTPSYTNGGTTCTGTPITFTYTVNPTPTAIATPASQTICSATAITTIVITGNAVAGVVYNWTRDNTGTVTGIAASGAGNISGTLTNTTNIPITVTFTIIPTANGCPGAAITATVTVNPIPDVNQPASQVVCNGAPTAPVIFTGSVAGTIFNWTNSNATIGLAASGTGNIASFNAINTGTAPVVATVTVTPSTISGGGPGSATFNFTGGMQTFTVPAGVTSINIQAFGAQGGTGAIGGNAVLGGTGGLGASATGTLAVVPGQVLNIFVGGQGASPAGGFNGGANGGSVNAGGGGGASDVRAGGVAAANRVITAGGGGGGGRGGCHEGAGTGGIGGNGGVGGGGVGQNGNSSVTSGGVAGGGFGGNAGSVQGAFGAKGIGCAGFSGQDGFATATEIGGVGGGGQACCCSSQPAVVGGGGGGGGQTGGGGGGGGSAGTTGCSGNSKGAGGGGGGGSSFTGGVTAGATTAGVQSGNGQVIITYIAGTVCTGPSKTFTYTVNPTPNATATPAAQTICSGSAITTIVNSGTVPGTVFNWVRDNPLVTGIANSGAGNISGSLTNPTNVPVTVTFTVTPSYTNAGVTCTGTPVTATVVVNPIPTVNPVANQVVCNGAPTAPVNFTGAVTAPPGTVYNWTNNTPVIGLAASGTGNIASFIAFNSGINPLTATITVTPSYTNAGVTCTGTPIIFTITVNPTPIVYVPANAFVCNGSVQTTGTYNFTTSAGGGVTTYTWTNNDISIGLGASGSGNSLPTFTATNPTAIPITATITVTPTFTNGGVSCVGTPSSFTITVYPTPNAVATPASQTVCSGTAITTIVLTSAVAGTTYTWTRDNNATVTGIAASGSGDISGILTNTTLLPVLVTFTITPTANGCVGPTTTATVLVNPTPNATAAPVSQTICSGSAITPIVLSGTVAGTTFTWTRDNLVDVTGIPASGSGSPISGTLTNSVTSTAPELVTFTITPSANGCAGTPITATVLVNPIPNAVATPASQAACSGVAITPIILSGNVVGTIFTWTRDNTVTAPGIAASGTGDIIGTLTNATASPITVTFTITPSFTNGGVTCTGPSITATVVVNPIPTATAAPSSQTVCSGVPITTIVLTSTVSGTTYNWTRDNTGTVTGMPGSGVGNISGTLTNTTLVPVLVTFTITPVANGCGGAPITATVLVNPTPNAVATPASQTICSGTAITTIVLTGSIPGTVFNWTRNNTATVSGIAASGSGNISGTLTSTNPFPITVTFTITPTTGGCAGTPITATVLVNPTPVVTPVANQVYCNGATTATITFNGTPGSTFNWTNSNTGIGLAASGTGDILPFVTTNATNGPITATITVTPILGVCPGLPVTFTITVNPTPIVNPVTSQILCNGQTTATVNFTSPTTGPTGALAFHWTNSAPSIGLASNGINSIPPFVAVNTGLSPIIALITVTPVYTNGGITCTGTSQTFTITVNPTPTVNPVANQVVCVGSATAAVNFTGSVFGTIYNWTNNNTSIGLAAAGAGNIASFTTINTGTTPQVATITVTPNYTNTVTCPGPPITFTITVNPIPSVTPVASQTVCAGATVTQAFSGPVAGTVFNWTNSNTAIGLAASGTGNLSFVSTNASGAPITGTITVTPTYTNSGGTCTGASQTFTITVNPIPTVNAVLPQILCNGSNTAAVNFTGAVAGTVYSWTNSNTTIGLAASGTGNIASFVATNVTAVVQTATITVTPTFTNGGVTCTGTAITFTITVNPTPAVNTVANQTVCAGTATTAVTITGPVAATTYNWINSNPSIGLGASGTNTIPSFIGINAGSTPVTATITITPVFTNGGVSCPGTASTFTITVNPTAVVNQPADQILCNGANTAAVVFSGLPPGSIYNWTNSNTAIGLAASGTGNIPSFIATNATAAPITATITVTPSSTGCGGLPVSFTITVNPTPSVNPIVNQTVCAGSVTAAITISGPVAGTVYTWTNSNTTIGLGASGIGNIPAFITVNPTGLPVTATITVTATYTNGGVTCVGPTRSFTITVNPLPNIVFTNVPPRVCLTDSLVILGNKVTPAGGTWSGNGVTGSTFSSTLAGLGVHNLRYTVTGANGCTATSIIPVTVNDCKERHNIFATAIRIWPNPSSGRFSIQFNSDIYSEFNMNVVVPNGQVIKSYQFKNLRFGIVLPVDLTLLPAGTYWLQIYNASERAHFPFVIAR